MVKVGLKLVFVEAVVVGAMALYGQELEPVLVDQVNDKALPLLTEDVFIKLKVPGDVQSTTGGGTALV